MKRLILLVTTFFFTSLHLANAQQCEDMIGTYRIIPFSKPVGLEMATKELLTSAPFGTPFFKVEKLNDQVWHLGLIRGNKYPITLIEANKKSETSLTGHADLCYYKLHNDFKIFKVDLTKLNKQQLSVLHDYILRGWGNEPLDKAVNHNAVKESYVFDIEALRKINYFLTIDYSEIGVGRFVFIFPLQKTTDKTKFTIAPSSPVNQYNPKELAIKQTKELILNKDTQASSACLMGECQKMETFLGEQQVEELNLLSCHTIQEKWSENPQPYQITPLMNAYLCLGNSLEKTDIEKARTYWLKGLSYLQDDSVKSLSDFRTYIVNGKEETERSMMFMAVTLLTKIITIDYKNKTYVYPTEVNHYLSSDKFSKKDIKQAIDWGCANRFTNDRERFYNGDFIPEDPDIFLRR